MGNVALTVSDVEQIAEGACKASRDTRWFAQLSRRGGKLVVETGWVVPEAYDDDAGASVSFPFRGQSSPVAWVGRRVETDSAAEALSVYGQFKAAYGSSGAMSRLPGEKIGSVSRGAAS